MTAVLVPDDWDKVAFGALVTNINDYFNPAEDEVSRYLAGEHIDERDLAVRRWGMTNDDAFPPTFKRIFEAGDVLFHSRNPEKVVQPDFNGVTGEKLFVLRTKDSSVLLQDLVPYLLLTDRFADYVRRTRSGSVNKFLNWTPLSKYEFALPPIDEQRRIATLLRAAEGNCVALAMARTAGEMSYRAMCKELFVEGREELATNVVGDIADVKNGMTPRRSRDDYWGGVVPWLPTAKVNERRIKAADEFITQKALDECSVRVVPAGSTLVAMVGQGATRGKAALLEIDATINQNFAAVTPREGIMPSFLYYQLDALYESLRNWSHGSNQKALNCRLVRDFPIWVPSEARQREVTERLEQVDKARKSLADREAAARALKKRILGNCFGGATS